MVSSVQCINRCAVVPDGTTTTPPTTQCDTPSAKPSFSSDYYECSYAPEEKKGSFLGFLAKTVFGLGIIAGGFVAARRFIPALSKDSIDIEKELAKDSKFFDKVKYYTATAGQKIEDGVVHAYNWCKDLVKGEKKTESKDSSKAPASNEENLDTSG